MGQSLTGQTPYGLGRARLRCAWCDTVRAPDLFPWCKVCGGSLAAEVDGQLELPAALRSLWDFGAVLPVGREQVTLGEGATPLLPLQRLYPDDAVFAKAEWMNPTGSFKDRAAAIGISAAATLGAKGIVCASTGNNGAAVSAYAARAGLPCIITLPVGTPAGKIAQARAHGATVAEVPGTFSDAYELAEAIREEDPSWANLTSTFANPFMTASHATITYELYHQLCGEIGTVIIPIGAGPMLAGILDGAERLRATGQLKTDTLPLLVGVQAAGCAPIARAFMDGADEVAAWDHEVRGVAGSINDPLRGYPADGTRTLRAVRHAGGLVQAVGDEEITRAMRDLGRVEGIACEPAAAASLAALRVLEQTRKLPRPIVLVISGHALKDPMSQPGNAATGEAVDTRQNGWARQIIAAAKAHRRES